MILDVVLKPKKIYKSYSNICWSLHLVWVDIICGKNEYVIEEGLFPNKFKLATNRECTLCDKYQLENFREIHLNVQNTRDVWIHPDIGTLLRPKSWYFHFLAFHAQHCQLSSIHECGRPLASFKVEYVEASNKDKKKEAISLHAFTYRPVRSLIGDNPAPAWKNKWDTSF